MGFVRTFCRSFLVIFSVVIVVCLVRTFVLVNLSHSELTKCSKGEGDKFIRLTDQTWQRLKDSLRYRTISYGPNSIETGEVEKLLKYIVEAHPVLFSSDLVTHEIVNGYSLLIHVRGRDQALLPYLLAAHLDVVPVTESLWSVGPFNATEDAEKTKVYGRGTLDDKGSLMAQLAALEFLLDRGIMPERSFYLAFGHDEEVLGRNGACFIAKSLRSKGVDRLHFVLDEGLVVMKELFRGIEVALVGVTEKGYADLNMTVELHGGHSSMPAKETSVGILAGAVARLQSNPLPARVDDLAEEMLTAIAPRTSFPLNIALCNLWLFKPAVTWALQNDRTAQGAVRTTTAVTIMRAGMKNNVIPTSAWAVINHRIHPMNSVEEVLAYNRKVVNDDRVNFNIIYSSPPHPISPYYRTSSLAYQVLTDTIEQIFENAVVAPATLVATTDTAHYLGFTRNVYRFNPVKLGAKEIASIHAEDEYISKENFEKMINFYYHLMRNADRTGLRDLFVNKEL